MSSRIPGWFFLVLAGAALAAMWPCGNGMIVSSDGVNYLSTAENIVKHFSLRNSTSYVERIHPAGYSVALAPFILIGLTALQAAFAVNWLSLVAIGLLSFLLLRELAGVDDWRIRLGAVLVMVNPATTSFAWQVLSETLFQAEMLLMVLVFYKLSKEEA